MQFMKKNKHDNDVSDRKDVIYAENEIKLLCLIRPSGVCVKN